MNDEKLDKIIEDLIKKEKIDPPKELLIRILSKLDPVTKNESESYSIREEIKGRPVINLINDIMVRWKYVIGAVFVGVVGGVLFMTQYKGSEPVFISEKELAADEIELASFDKELNLDFVEDPSFAEIDKSIDELLGA